ncbi:methoxymalonyl-ACP biosynthesis protein FkbH [Parafrankia colletiae]|uniref:Methoxymalonyl-ACP biosynthesis protein FkbH n=1 Tax=Parafrankia colletiae TaxID=573497 RepID=A0A1S1R4C9_9ACTN|nr:methoxymalonyl-ACP biosynthesis protein FkbH [Parafrankia colletiae]
MGTQPAHDDGTVPDLLDLHRSGQLVEHYPAVQGLLSDLSEEQLLRAGRLLARVDPAEVLARHPGITALTIAVVGHGTLAGLVPPLTAELARHGLLARLHLGAFGSYVADLADPASDLYAARPDLVLCLLGPDLIWSEVTAPWRPDDVDRIWAEKLALLEGLARHFEDVGHGVLVLNTTPLTRTHTAQLVDHASRARLGAVWREANARLLGLAEQHPALVVVDTDPLLAGGIPARDTRMSLYAKAHLSAELLAAYAREIGHLARAVTGRTRKTLVLDLDGTVWGGVLGDDGIDGIEIGETYRGEAFRTFQQVVRQLGSQGVLLAAVSKNDAETVHDVLAHHADMVLRESDLVRVVANWHPKHDNLRELATDLNLGVDSLVFADDSPYERGLVRREVPEVAVVALDDEPARHVEALLADGWFDVRVLTEEDHERPARYRAEADRRGFLHSFDSLDGYLRELGVRVLLAPATDSQVNRISQITLRTNQFNLTGERLQPAAVAARTRDPESLVLGIRCSDRFGDNGLAGAVLAYREDDTVHIDNFLLSCRVFSRGIEQACLSAVLRHARDTGADAVVGTYRETPRNGKVRDFYPRAGFVPVGAPTAQGAVFRHDLTEILPPPDHVALAVQLAGGETP